LTQINRNNKILVMLPSPMGDIILAGPALRRLRARMPGSHITFLTGPGGQKILEDCGWADEWILYDKHKEGIFSVAARLRRENFDSVILMSNSFRSALLVYLAGIGERIGYKRDGRGFLLTRSVSIFRLVLRIAPLAMADYYGYLVDKALDCLSEERGGCSYNRDLRLELFTGPSDRAAIDTLLQRWQISEKESMVILVPGGAFGGSKWWPEDRFAELADRLVKEGHKVIISCAPNETERRIARNIIKTAKGKIYNLVEENINLGGLKELVSRCRLMVSNDTGPCHIAAAFGVPLVTLFGPTDPRWTVTGYDNEIRLRVDVCCGPCQEEICRLDHRCLNEISVDDVFSAGQKLLAHNQTPLQNGPEHQAGSYYCVFKESFEPMGDGFGLVHKNYRSLLEKAQLGSLDAVFNYHKGERLHKPGLGRRERFRLKLTGDKKDVVIYLKRYGAPGFWEWLRRGVTRRNKAATAVYDFAASMTLAEKGVSVPRPIAYGQEGGRFREKRSFVMIEELPHADALERLLPNRKEKSQDYLLLRDQKVLIDKIAKLIRKLHEGGYYHRDLYLSHIFLCRDHKGEERLSLIDLQRVFRPVLRKRRWQVKDLAQLYYSAVPYFSRTDMIRFIRAYYEDSRLDTKQKRLMRAIYRKAEKIARHDRNRRQRLGKQ